MSELYNEDGDPVEAYTEDELNEKIEEFKKTGEEKDKEIEDLKKQMEESKSGEGSNSDKEYNFRKLDNIRKEKEKEASENAKLVKELQSKLEQVESTAKNVTDQRLTESKLNQKIEEFAGQDKELAKKVRHFYDEFKPIEETDPVKREEIFNERVDRAILLATGSAPKNPLSKSGVASYGGTTGSVKKGGLSDETKKFGKEKFGLSDEDLGEADGNK